MELAHFTQQPFIDLSRVYRQSRNWKPSGLWVSDEVTEDGWSHFCKRSDFPLGSNRFDVVLRPDANLLIIDSVTSLMDFDQDYGLGFDVIWPRVEQKYDGIIITPYQWSQRLGKIRWYYTWDCASGCIWNLDSIERVVQR